MFEIVLVEPEIPPNTGNVIRLAANTGCRLHLVQPLGFDLSDKQLRRAGLDYHEYAELVVHADWAALKQALCERRRFAFTTKAARNYAEIAFQPGVCWCSGRKHAACRRNCWPTLPPMRVCACPCCPDSAA